MTIRSNLIFQFLLAWLVGAAAVTLLSTHVVLQGLVSVGAEFSLNDRISASLTDLIGFGPVVGLVVFVGFLIAFPVAHGVSTRLGALRTFGYVSAGFVAIAIALLTIAYGYQFFSASDTMPIATVRSIPDLLVVCLGGAFGGLIFALTGKQ